MNLMGKLRVHAGDDLPTLYLQLFSEPDQLFIDLSDADDVVTAKFREKGTTTVLETITCAKLYGGSTGYVSMTWPADAFDVDAGVYEIELSISFDGDVQTANNYYWDDSPDDWSTVIPVKIVEDF